jgi:hypothetical protein
MKINGYSPEVLEYYLFPEIEDLFKADFDIRLNGFEDRLRRAEQDGEVLFVSLGSDCGPGIRLKEAGLLAVGSFYFDALVCPLPATIKLLTEGFRKALRLENLEIGVWEGIDSVRDKHIDCYFHHSFYLPDEKRDEDGRRRIDLDDIPMFLPLVRAKFAYLEAKFERICASPVRKIFFVRKVEFTPFTATELAELDAALIAAGAINYSLAPVYSVGDPSGAGRQYRIPCDVERWGTAEAWRALAEELAWL